MISNTIFLPKTRITGMLIGKGLLHSTKTYYCGLKWEIRSFSMVHQSENMFAVLYSESDGQCMMYFLMDTFIWESVRMYDG